MKDNILNHSHRKNRRKGGNFRGLILKTQAIKVVTLVLMILFLASAASAGAETFTEEGESTLSAPPSGETTFAYLTDAETPHTLINNSTSSINVSTYQFPLDGSPISADIILIDVSGNENLTYLEYAIASGDIAGQRIAFTNESSYLSSVPAPVQENASLYWTWTAENLENLLVYTAVELDGRTDLDGNVEPLRTSILLVVLPNWGTIESVRGEISEYGIDCRFANISAMQKVARDPSQAAFVNEEIEAWKGDVLFEYVADAQYGLYKEQIDAAGERDVKVLGIGGFSAQNPYFLNVEDGKNVTEKLFSKYSDPPGYWRTVLPENLVRMFIYIANETDSRPDLEPFVKPTMTVPPDAIYHPDYPGCEYKGDFYKHLCQNREEYNEWYRSSGHYNPSDKWIGIAMYYRDYQEGALHTEDAMIRDLEEDGYNVVASYVPWEEPINRFYDNSNETMKVDSIISFLLFGATDKHKVLDQSDVPVLKAVKLTYQTQEGWEKNPYGMNGASITWKLDQPEIDGVICPIPVEAKLTEDDCFCYPIPDRVDRMLGQAEAFADLRHSPEEEKRIAIIYFNHPPGKQNVGASYLNLFESLSLMLDSLRAEGYGVQNMTPEELHTEILEKGRNVGTWAPEELDALVEAGIEDDSIVLLDANLYESWFNELPESIRNDVVNSWGEAPGKMMVVNREGKDYIVIPIIKNGNMILTPEPARGWEEDTDRLYHDLNIAPPHQYMAFYLWLQHPPEEGGFGAEAVVHVGRHGTQEWLPGKMVCLNATSYPDLLLGDVPNIYPYIVDGAGEGIQAKRRGYATLISHLTPPIAKSGVYGDLTELKNYLRDYQEYRQSGYETGMNETKNAVIELLNNSTVDEDLELTVTDENFEEALDEIVEYLEEISAETIPYGTHTFGQSPEGEKAAMFLETMHADLLMNTSCTLLGYDVDAVSAGGIEVLEESSNAENLSNWLALSIENCSPESRLFTEALEEHLNRSLSPEELDTLNETFETANKTLFLLNTSGELTSFTHALDGGYILPSEQGDPVNNPNVLPTGRNYYGFESKKIPNPETWETGKELADEMLLRYYSENGEFPEKVGVCLWSVETLRHKGVMEAMTLRLMGAEPEFYYSYGAFSKVYNDKVGVTPLEDLKITLPDGTTVNRPRVDVVITISGLYRDTLQYQIRLLDTATHTISGLEEAPEDNYVKKHTLEIEEALLAMDPEEQQKILDTYMAEIPEFSGTFEELAGELAAVRIFAPPPGGYGVGIEKEIGAGGTDWNSENGTETIGNLYIFRMANLYTVDSEGFMHYLGNYESIFRENLNGTDVVINSRSSSLYGVLDNDDFFQYVGGLSAAVQAVSGEAPEVLVANLRGDPKIEGLGTFIAKELRSRIENPFYLEGMVGSDYSGLKEIAEMVDNLYGFQVTTPDVVKEYMWNDIYETIILDKYEMGLKEAFYAENPYAYQNMVATMLEAIDKGYWEPSDEVVDTLTSAYLESVETHGKACSQNICGNPNLPGSSSSKKDSDSSQKAGKNTGGSGTGSATVISAEEARSSEGGISNQSLMAEGGYGAELEKNPQPDMQARSTSDANYVEGYEMKKESPEKSGDSGNMPISPSDIIAIASVMLLSGAIFVGYQKKKL
ncbi:cobaltochelatase subunit CobN [Methanosarcina sp. Mfa9]|uniref:cobaltochelatase subunit CobN n=1 Tax=Methanosarcina sp. Mfa9 TaxID=3439063 RepID=UPI003F82DC96